MANAWRNSTIILGIVLKAMRNKLVLAKMVDRQVTPAEFNGKRGDTVYVKRPVSFTATDDAEITAGQLTDVEQATVPVQLDTWKKVSFSLTQKERTLNIKDISNEILKPAGEELAQVVETLIGSKYKYIPNFLGTPGTTPSTFLEIGQARQRLLELGVPDDIYGMLTPETELNIANALKATADQGMAKSAIEKAYLKRVAGMDLYGCQSLPTHTVGVNTGTPLVKGAAQVTTYALSKDTQTQSLITDGWTVSQTGILKAGDVLTIAGVYSVNARTRVSTGNLLQLTVMEDADSDGSGDSTLTVSPPMIASGPYQTCDAGPADGAALTVLTGTGGTQYRNNIFMHKNCMTLAFAKLAEAESGSGVISRQVTYDGISMLYTVGTDITTTKTIYRLDLLCGVKVQNPQFGLRITE